MNKKLTKTFIKHYNILDKNWKIIHVFHCHYIIYFLRILIISSFLLFVLNYLYPLILYVQLTKKDLDHSFPLVFLWTYDYSRYETQGFNFQPPIVSLHLKLVLEPFQKLVLLVSYFGYRL